MRDVTPKNWPYQTPENIVLCAIGDLHGHLEVHNQLYALLEAFFEREKQIYHKKKIYFVYLGDYIDRGPESAQLIEKLIRLKECDGRIQHRFLRGNHENGLLGFLENADAWKGWLEYGGIETAQSYGVEFTKRAILPAEREQFQIDLRRMVPQSHLDFLNTLELSVTCGDYFFAHAGIRPEIPLEEQTLQDLTFIREPFLSWEDPHKKCVVHGHTITSSPEIRSNRIGLDTGLYQTGILTCGIFEGARVKILQVQRD